MSERIIVGYWNCASCGTKKIRGTCKNCPNCSAPKGNAKYYLDAHQKEYLEKEIAKDYAKGANWICPYCGNQNRYYATNCQGCGSSKENAEEDYFGENPNESKTSKRYERHSFSYYEESAVNERENDKYSKDDFDEIPETSNSKFYNFFLKHREALLIGLPTTLAFIALIVAMILIFMPHTYTATLNDKSWKRAISIEEYKTVKESDWSVPSGGRVYDEREEIHHYEHVLDHYETIEVTKSREVIDHYDTQEVYSYADNGDGTFTEYVNTISVPVYRTEYYTVTEEEPVYIDVPVKKIKYYYEIEKWTYNRTEKASGKNEEEVYWPEYKLADNERVSGKSETYTLVFKTEKKDYNKIVPKEEYYSMMVGTKVKIKVSAGVVIEYEILADENNIK